MRMEKTTDGLVAWAPAKLNLSLRILAKRPDGFHEIETVMVSIQHYDTLQFARRMDGEIRLRCEDLIPRQTLQSPKSAGSFPASIPEDDTNLVVRAARLLKEYAGSDQGVQVLLQKRIPAAAGLAGGSSDAATTLAALNKLWNLRLSLEELCQLAAKLGSDIPFFLCGEAMAVCRGRGELIEPWALTETLWFVVAKPEEGLSTARVYQHCRPTHDSPAVAPLLAHLAAGNQWGAAHALHNGLQAAALELCPAVRQLEAEFAKLDVLAHQMSGSGTAYFGWCANQAAANHAAARLTAKGLGQVFVACSGV
ncbi:MAG: 4-(cytidine 5'-diphospho)-2-C-methyl-D-erythritol kinase [Planctomyces sp.]|nr:4-(cytidine 5'-diphospho)-2-C-methyl-D-erythritol kinase [Planctomyces sp.]